MKRKHRLAHEAVAPPDNRLSARAPTERPSAGQLAALNKFVEPRDYESSAETAARHRDRWGADCIAGARPFPP